MTKALISRVFIRIATAGPTCAILIVLALGNHGMGQQSNDEQWRSVEAGNGRFSDGTFLAWNTYEAVDNTRVNVTQGTFRSAEAARKEMHKWLHTASRVVDPLKRDSSGERAVGLFTPESGGKYTAILVVKGARLIWISSSSVKRAMQMERYLVQRSSAHAKNSIN